MPRVDLNCDLGEEVGDDAALFAVVTSANVACGFHAGDAETMRRSCELAARHGVVVGAHPSYRDREGFGRREVEIDAASLTDEVVEQTTALRSAAHGTDVEVRYLKPHGALYNRIVHDERQATAVARAAAQLGLPLLGLAGSAIEAAAAHTDVPFFREAFADRGYLPSGALAPRGTPGSLLTDPDVVAARVVRMVTDGTVLAVDGSTIRVEVDSVCLHGDTPSAAAMAESVRRALTAHDVELTAFR
ncbi:5-oxoprolinase subunit PxpA [Herbiconiux sp. L3-i23]|uniref:5-oxoprolinase subunit PxpA n=1 Tax=Herbiconiux sp. L3-i23 TaxID=2905871 RepID=UPI00204F3499|nr:5-oxoprolinase subunit PxpA [Herbiconiux sp. L3-i23]BDI23775.1 UPF0271 protein [Herbiconiux sp. L3-i23]